VVVVVNLIIQIFLAVIIFWGFKILGVIRFQTSPSMHIPMIYPYMAVPVGSIFMLINSLRVSAAALTGGRLDREVRV
jgi:TRAP-type C4-dicarboxylate transport system permease small subunit